MSTGAMTLTVSSTLKTSGIAMTLLNWTLKKGTRKPRRLPNDIQAFLGFILCSNRLFEF